jgi:uncharacterized protein YhbP (UPF0306 family)
MPSERADEAQGGERAAALRLIAQSAVMTLAVAAPEGPWAAPVYYVYRPADSGFYFFSSPESRHIKAALQSGTCGAAIFRPAAADGGAWEEICGLQMRGQLTPATASSGVQALALYLKKFPFSRDLLPAGKAGLETFRVRLGVRLYRFRADHVEWTDNRIRFGYRCRLVL